jgi:hypothetical protein
MINKFTRLYKINVFVGVITMISTVIISLSEYSRMKSIMDERKEFMIKEKNTKY